MEPIIIAAHARIIIAAAVIGAASIALHVHGRCIILLRCMLAISDHGLVCIMD